jgi:Spy/CpxP family protein refolding chaperone
MKTPFSSMMLAMALALLTAMVLGGPAAKAQTQALQTGRDTAAYDSWKRAYLELTAEQRQAYDRIMEEHGAKVAPLRVEMRKTRNALNKLQREPNPDPTEMQTLSAQIDACQQKLLELRREMSRQIQDETGMKPPYFHKQAGAKKAS